MPELPEVELTARNLRAWSLGRVIRRAAARPGTPLRTLTPARLASGLGGQKIEAIERHGKQLFIRLAPSELVLSVHLGMTGRFVHRARGDGVADAPRRRSAKSERMSWTLDDGSVVAFIDPRRFGRVRLESETQARAHPEVKKLGPDAYQVCHEPGGLARVLERLKTPIKVALMDQRRLAGIGNIYASEGLFRAKIAPSLPARDVGKKRAAILAKGLVAAMDESIRLEAGEEVRYVEDPGGWNHFRVYDREGQPCPRCRTPIERTVQAGRSTFFCHRCQAG